MVTSTSDEEPLSCATHCSPESYAINSSSRYVPFSSGRKVKSSCNANKRDTRLKLELVLFRNV